MKEKDVDELSIVGIDGSTWTFSMNKKYNKEKGK